MKTKKLEEVEELAHKILTTYFCDSDVEFMISTFADDILWLGGGEKQKAEGKAAVAACFRMGKDAMIACDMSEEEFHSLELGGGNYLCEGISHLHSRPSSETYLNIMQRVTFIFRQKGEQLETVHIHNSVPYARLGEDELFPIESGRAELERLKSALNLRNQEYEHQARFLESLYNSVPCGIIQFSVDAGHEVVVLNPMAWKIYGYQSEEDYRSVVNDAMHTIEAEDYEWILSVIEGLVLNGKTAAYHRRCIRRNGEEAWINVVMGRIVNSNGKEVIQAVFTDMTEQIRMQKEREQERILENQFLRAAIYTVYSSIMSVNLTKDTYNCFVDNQDIYRMPEAGVFSQMMQDCLPEIYSPYQEDYSAAFNRGHLLEHFAAGEQEIYMELKRKGFDRQYHWIALHFITVENPFNTDVLAIGLVRVMDEQRMEQARQEQLLRDALVSAKAANRAKSDFLSRMSHDIRTPMNAVIGMSTIGQLKSTDEKVVRDCFRKIDASSKYLLSLINDILDMSKIETDKMEIANDLFDFKGFVEEVNQIIYPQTVEKGLLYEMRHQEPLESHYIGDSLRMKQILMNLLSNALKFTPVGGSIGVDIREKDRGNGFSYLEFVVWDTGIGMSEEFMEKIFQPFEQESPGGGRNNVGSGLGLSIVYNLVQLMGGDILVESKKNKGSKFTVTIPFQLVSAEAEREWEKKRQNLLRGLRVLVVDDDLNVCRQTADILDDIGAKTVWANSGLRAVEEVEKGLCEHWMFDIAMIDWKMPGIDGIETVRRIRKLVGPDTMIIMMTAYDWTSIEAEAEEAGIDCFIAKPLFRSTIYDTFSKINEKEMPKEDISASTLAGRRILLVEDNLMNQEIAKTLLEMHGAQIEVAGNGKEAVECYLAHASGYYQAVLMDIRMPVMNGLEATKAIRSTDREDSGTLPILAMTANAFEEDKREARSVNMTGYLVKPLDVNVLISELKKYL